MLCGKLLIMMSVYKVKPIDLIEGKLSNVLTRVAGGGLANSVKCKIC